MNNKLGLYKTFKNLKRKCFFGKIVQQENDSSIDNSFIKPVVP